MTYCTQQDLIERFGERELIQLTEDDGSGVSDAVKVARAIADAAATIDGHLQGRYTLPLSAVPHVLTRHACDLARYYLHDDRATELVEHRYKEAIAYLRAVGTGQLGLGLAADDAVAMGSGGPEVSAPARVFSDDALKGY